MDQKCLEEKSTSAFLACRALNGHVRLADVTFTRRVTEGISQALPINSLRSRGPPLPIFAVAFLVDVAFVHFYFFFSLFYLFIYL